MGQLINSPMYWVFIGALVVIVVVLVIIKKKQSS